MKLYSLSLLCCAAALRPSTRGIRKSVFYATSTRKRTLKKTAPQLDTTTDDERVVHMDDIPIYLTAVSPNSRLIDRRAVATATKIGDTAYIFIVSAAAVKWKDEQERVTATARTFTAS